MGAQAMVYVNGGKDKSTLSRTSHRKMQKYRGVESTGKGNRNPGAMRKAGQALPHGGFSTFSGWAVP